MKKLNNKFVKLSAMMSLMAFLLMPTAAQAQYKGTNGRIFYGGVDTTSGTSSVLPDGTNIHVHGINYVTNSMRGAVVSPNGNTLAYVDVPGSSGTQSDIFTGAMASSVTGTNITNTPSSSEDSPYFSSNGSKIVFTRQPLAGGNVEVWVMNSDGTGQTQLTNNIGGGASLWPVWAPDDSVIYIFSTTNQEIGYISPTTPNQTTATKVFDVNQSIDGMDVDPVAGTTIVYSTLSNSKYALFTVNTNGTGNTQISTNNTRNYNKPNYSPDGTKLVANTYVNGITDDTMTVMLANGSSEQNILQDKSGKEYIFVNSYMFWSTNQSTYGSIGPNANTPGAPNTSAFNKFEKNLAPIAIASVATILFAGLLTYFGKTELDRRKKRH